MLFTGAAQKSYLFRRQWKCMCATEPALRQILQNAFMVCSSFTFLLLVHLHPDSAKSHACVAPPHTWLSALLEQKNYSRCTVFFPAVVHCCRRAAVLVFAQFCFSSKTACGNLYSFFITQGFCK